MSANRKLLGEIQLVLKKVEEGVEIFDETWGKVYAAEQQTLKEKYESDLKKEIKKLQRLRDQIKTWIGSTEIKDKTQLMEARKTIESKMELFKVCEKDTKTKAYSKEGLARDAKLDPKDALKEEKRGWLNDCLDKLNDLIDSVEAEREKVLGSKGKGKNKESLEKFDNRVQKHKWHMAKLELIIKLLDNDDLDPALVSGIQDSLDYYIESAIDDDGALGVEHEFDIYEDLALDSLGVAVPTFDLAAARTAKDDEEATASSSSSSSDHAADPADHADGEASAPLVSAAAAKKPAAAVASVSGGAKAAGKTEAAVSAAAKPTAAAVSAGAKASAKVNPAVPASAAAAKGAPAKGAAQKVAASEEQEHEAAVPSPVTVAPAGPSMSWAAHAASAVPAPTPAASTANSIAATATPAVVPAPPSSTPSSVAVQASPATAPQQQPPLTKSPALAALPPPAAAAAAVVAPASSAKAMPSFVEATATVSSTPSPAPSADHSPVPVPASTTGNARVAATDSSTVSAAGAPPPPPPLQQAKSNSDLMVQTLMGQLKQSMMFSPEAMELDKQSSLLQYAPRNVYPHTHPTFPLSPQFTTQTEIADLFERLPMDTLFFVFYFQQGTYQQYLAAKQLKKHSWRFHKKYMTWFQRHEEPKVATEEYEEGTYVYFDYESGWCQRIKSEFKFEYAYLEDELGGEA